MIGAKGRAIWSLSQEIHNNDLSGTSQSAPLHAWLRWTCRLWQQNYQTNIHFFVAVQKAGERLNSDCRFKGQVIGDPRTKPPERWHGPTDTVQRSLLRRPINSAGAGKVLDTSSAELANTASRRDISNPVAGFEVCDSSPTSITVATVSCPIISPRGEYQTPKTSDRSRKWRNLLPW